MTRAASERSLTGMLKTRVPERRGLRSSSSDSGTRSRQDFGHVTPEVSVKRAKPVQGGMPNPRKPSAVEGRGAADHAAGILAVMPIETRTPELDPKTQASTSARRTAKPKGTGLATKTDAPASISLRFSLPKRELNLGARGIVALVIGWGCALAIVLVAAASAWKLLRCARALRRGAYASNRATAGGDR